MPELYSLLAISKELGIAESTLRYYVRNFDEYIPYIGEGRGRKYKPEAIEVLRTIAKMFKNNQSVTNIANQLSLKFPRNIPIADDSQPQVLTKYSPNELPTIFKEFMEIHLEIVKQSVTKDKELTEQKAIIEQKNKEIAELQDIAKRAEEMEAEIARLKNRSWWERLFSK